MKRRILCLDYILCNFHNLIALAKDGHTVFMTTSEENFPTAYYESFGITTVDSVTSSRDSLLQQFIVSNKIDTVINQNPNRDVHNSLFRDLDYIGISLLSGHLESRKVWCRKNVGDLGVKLPRLLDNIEIPCVIKPCKTLNKKLGRIRNTVVLLDERNVKYLDEPYYIEEYLSGCIETNVEFVVSGGKWSIQHCQQALGEESSKIAGNLRHWTKTASYAKLSDVNRSLTIDNATKILDWVATLGGSFQGQLTGLIKNNEWYFCEINSRPAQCNSLPIFCTGDEYLESMLEGKPNIIGNAFPWDVHKVIVQPMTPDAIYPFELHEKYGVSVPCGLDIIDGEYRVSMIWFRDTAPEELMGIAIIDDQIPDDFIKEFENNSNFSVSHCFI